MADSISRLDSAGSTAGRTHQRTRLFSQWASSALFGRTLAGLHQADMGLYGGAMIAAERRPRSQTERLRSHQLGDQLRTRNPATRRRNCSDWSMDGAGLLRLYGRWCRGAAGDRRGLTTDPRHWRRCRDGRLFRQAAALAEWSQRDPVAAGARSSAQASHCRFSMAEWRRARSFALLQRRLR